MSFNDGFSIKAIPFPVNSPVSGNALIYDGTQWIAGSSLSGAVTTINAGQNLTGSRSNGTYTVALSQSVTGLNKLVTTELTASRAYIIDDIIVNGTASIVQLNTQYQTSLVVGDKYITILSASTDHITLDGAGMLWGSGAAGETVDDEGANAHVRYSLFYDALEIFPGLYVSGNTLGSTAQFDSVTASFNGNGSNITNLTSSNIDNFTNDVRNQITAGNGISVVSGVIAANITDVVAGTNMVVTNNSGIVTASLSSSVSGLNNLQTTNASITTATASNVLITGDLKVNGTASFSQINTLNQTSLNLGDKYITILTGGVDHATLDGSGILWGSGSADPTVDEFGANAHIRFRASTDLLEIFPGVYVSGTTSGSTANFTSVTASFNGNGSNITNLTASNIVNFISDVRKQISGSQYVTYNTSSGVISLPFTGTILGTTPLILGQTTSSLTGMSFISSSVVVCNTFVTGTTALGANLQILTGTNRPAGTLTLNGSTNVTVTNTLVTTSSLIFLTKQTNAKNNGVAAVSGRANGSFTVASNVNNDTDIVAYLIINPV